MRVTIESVLANNAYLEQLASIRRSLANLLSDYNRSERFYRKRDDLVDELHELGMQPVKQIKHL